jgi:hypothetical protein
MGMLMKHYGNIDLNNNLMQKMVFETEINFPDIAIPGRIVFKDKRVYICAEIVTGFPVWIPLTNELDTFVLRQTTPSATWTVTHNLNTVNPLVQVYGTDLKMVIPDNITVVDNNTVLVTFGYPIAGRCVAMFGSSLVGASKSLVSFEYTQTSPSATWIINHDLGYYPIVRIFVGNEEIQPAGIVHNSIFQTTVTFTMPFVGIARLV